MTHTNSAAGIDDADLADLVARLAGRHAGERGALLPLLHGLQAELGFIPDEAVPHLATALNLTRAEVHGVITFYPDFRRQPAGAHIVKICRAEACQARGGAEIAALAALRLETRLGTTRADGRVTLEAVYCAIGPNALVDGRPMARIDAARLDLIVALVAA